MGGKTHELKADFQPRVVGNGQTTAPTLSGVALETNEHGDNPSLIYDRNTTEVKGKLIQLRYTDSFSGSQINCPEPLVIKLFPH